jgi:TRAP-type C4-dicarboxylate transport system substrate-binding protein
MSFEMKVKLFPTSPSRIYSAAAIASTAVLAAGCAGGVQAGNAGETGAGYEYGASESEIREALADMEPTTLVFQPAAMSESDVLAQRPLEFKEKVEALSDGKITVDIVYAQAIAPYLEVADALVDGRVDIAMLPVVYYPNEFPEYNAPVAATTQLPSSPLVGELAATAAIAEYWGGSTAINEELDEQGLMPIIQIEPNGPLVTTCNTSLSEPSDWEGQLVRGSSVAQAGQIEGMGASPLSLPPEEIFEALQRNTLNCAVTPYSLIPMMGLAEVAPEVHYSTNVSFARGPGTITGGSKVRSLPLAAQQLIFDQALDMYKNSRLADFENHALAAKTIREAGGSLTELSDEAQKELESVNDAMIKAEIDNGSMDEDVVPKLRESYDKWFAIAEELGYKDEGGIEDFDQWFSEDIDLEPFAARLFEEVLIEGRPAAG